MSQQGELFGEAYQPPRRSWIIQKRCQSDSRRWKYFSWGVDRSAQKAVEKEIGAKVVPCSVGEAKYRAFVDNPLLGSQHNQFFRRR